MKYQKRGLTFIIEKLDDLDAKTLGCKYLATQVLTEEQSEDPNYLREVHSGDTEEEVKASIDNFEGFRN